MPQILKAARNGQIKVKSHYTTGDIAHMMGIAHSTASRIIDSGEIRSIRLLTRNRPRRITHAALINFVRRNPSFKYMLERLSGYDPGGDFPVGTEPPPPARQQSPPWSPETPRSAYRGQIPQAAYYSAKEVAFLLGLTRRTVITKLDAKVIPGIKVPATRPGLTTTWKWRITHKALIAFIGQNPRYSYALDRIQGCEASSSDCSSRKEPLVAPGAPGWCGRPNQTRRGGFKRGPKLPDGRQPSLTKEDVAAMADSRTERRSALSAQEETPEKRT